VKRVLRKLREVLLPPPVFLVKQLVFCRTSEVTPLRLSLDHVSVDWATRDDLPVLLSLHGHVSALAQRFDRGWLCTLARWKGEQPVGYAWFDVGDVHHSRNNAFRFRLGPDACWGTNLFVHSDYRLRGVFYKLWLDSVALLKERGARHIYHTINRENVASIGSHLRLGSEILFRYRVVRMLGLVHHSIRSEGDRRLDPVDGWGIWEGSDPFLDGI
jgi:GNAT superfamily N-acetyltransferase